MQMNVDKLEELRKCTSCLNKELEKLKHDNVQLKKAFINNFRFVVFVVMF